MFSTHAKSEDGFEQIILKDDVSATSVAIIPSCGAILHGFHVLHGGQQLNVIDHYEDAADFEANVTNKGFKSCKLSPFSCRIKNGQYHFGEKDYTIQKFFLGPNAIHGLIYDAPFTVVRQQATENGAEVLLQYQYRGTDSGYPFQYDCLVHYQLKQDNALTITTEIINRDKGLIPMQDGWHPYFTFGGSINELQLEFQAKDLVVFDDGLIPTGELRPYETFGALRKIGDTFFDTCFSLNFAECQPLCVLRDPVKRLQLEIIPGKNYPYLQVYTPPHRNSIAIENLSAAPDTYNNQMGLHVLQPSESVIFTTTYKISALSE